MLGFGSSYRTLLYGHPDQRDYLDHIKRALYRTLWTANAGIPIADQFAGIQPGVPGRRYGEFVQTLQDFQNKVTGAKEEIIDEVRWNACRLVIAHSPVHALEQTTLRRQRIAQIQTKVQQWASKLDGQDAGETGRGRKLSDSGAKARLYHEVSEAHLARIIKVDLFHFQIICV